MSSYNISHESVEKHDEYGACCVVYSEIMAAHYTACSRKWANLKNSWYLSELAESETWEPRRGFRETVRKICRSLMEDRSLWYLAVRFSLTPEKKWYETKIKWDICKPVAISIHPNIPTVPVTPAQTISIDILLEKELHFLLYWACSHHPIVVT